MFSIILGLSLGTLYGLFFVLQQRRALSLDRASFAQHMIKAIFFSMMRFTLCALGVIYVLHSSSINLILVIISFLAPLIILPMLHLFFSQRPPHIGDK